MKYLTGVTVSALAVFLLISGGCNNASNKKATRNIAYASAEASMKEGQVLAKIEGESVSENELMSWLTGPQKGAYIKAKTDLYQQQKSSLNEYVFGKLLEKFAKEKDKSADEILKSEVQDKVKPVSDAEAKKKYDEIAEKNKGGRPLPPFDDVKSQIIQSLNLQNEADQKEAFFQTLTKKYSVTYYLNPPRMEVDLGNNPVKGPKDAPITIVEFSDFECPFCEKGATTLAKVMDQYKGKIKLYFRDFPLSFHKNAEAAAIAARCAGEQDKFWPYHDLLFEKQKEWAIKNDTSNQVQTKLVELAKSLKLKTEPFETCLKSEEHRKAVASDMQAGANAGVSGTPAFFVNGILLSGALPAEEFEKVIDEELARLTSQKPEA